MALQEPDVDSYHRQLQSVCKELSAAAESITIIGSDIAQFVNASRGNRAVNLSWANEGILVEFWDGDENVRDVIEPSYEAAIQTAQRWLRSQLPGLAGFG